MDLKFVGTIDLDDVLITYCDWAIVCLHFYDKNRSCTHCKTGLHDLTPECFFLKKSCFYLFSNYAILSVPESYVQGVVQGIQNLNSSLIYLFTYSLIHKAFAVLVSRIWAPYDYAI